ncbi:Y4cG protein [Mycobacterium bohemicum DSM 44277]|uniref:Resolvase n=2 Tax=Mycobacterium bohemicum TaxID=56425 RepID=A0A1X1QY67_MYCBE|nr:recombinase family protein [Mycobacterium bohemicum]MCV6968983.1 recombinase family protein [Mycobacterium bohemicum]ORU96399.1 resolvase [Mycobacterium bohemicum]CPR11276.1 Y4cG protein [Mycobacterium bohemicum DSM 44277]
MSTSRTRRRNTTPAAGTAVAYLRVSTEEQAASGAGIDAQRAAITAEADRRGLAVTAWHVDEGVSGAKAVDARAALSAAIEDVETGRAAVLLVAKSDRLARNLRSLLDIIDRAERAGGAVVAVDGTVDTSTAAGRFTTQIMGGVAELERSLISDRTKAALAARKAAGVRLGRPVSVAPTIADRIVAERNDGATWQAIADRLNDDGTQTGQGGAKWFPNTVARIYKRVAA